MSEFDQEPVREGIIAAALRVIARQGVAGASMRAVARELGRTTGTITHHFRDRHDLLVQVAEEIADRAVERVRSLPHETPVQALRRKVAALVIEDGEGADEASSALHLLTSALPDPAARNRQRRLREDLREELHWTLEALHVAGEAPPTLDPDREADRLLCLMEGLRLNALLDPLRFTPNRQRAILLEHLSRMGISA